VRSSRVTTVVPSAAYLDDHWAALGEQLAAYASVAKDVHSVLLLLLVKDCKLTLHVQALGKLDFRDPSRTLWDAASDRLRAYPIGPPRQQRTCRVPMQACGRSPKATPR